MPEMRTGHGEQTGRQTSLNTKQRNGSHSLVTVEYALKVQMHRIQQVSYNSLQEFQVA